jgi:hypothetical protein
MGEYNTLTIVLNFIRRPTVVESSDMILAGSTGPERGGEDQENQE